jgi:hypothetical protein
MTVVDGIPSTAIDGPCTVLGHPGERRTFRTDGPSKRSLRFPTPPWRPRVKQFVHRLPGPRERIAYTQVLVLALSRNVDVLLSFPLASYSRTDGQPGKH